MPRRVLISIDAVVLSATIYKVSRSYSLEKSSLDLTHIDVCNFTDFDGN